MGYNQMLCCMDMQKAAGYSPFIFIYTLRYFSGKGL